MANPTCVSITAAEEIIQHATIEHLTPEIVSDTITLKQQMRVKTPDAIIASTSRIQKQILITGNGKHFERIPAIMTIQNCEGKAKPYQVRQFCKIIEKYQLLEEYEKPVSD